MSEAVAPVSSLSPAQIVAELDRHIVGQHRAKRAVAIALRNRWRRQQVGEPLGREIVPRNILMIGPTGVGKTEIARRLARLTDAPFIKVEATRFTEVGYVGRDVETIVRDLVEVAIAQTRERAMQRVAQRATQRAQERVLDILLPGGRPSAPAFGFGSGESPAGDIPASVEESPTRRKLRDRLLAGELDDRDIEVELLPQSPPELSTPSGMEEMGAQLQALWAQLPGRRSPRRVSVREALLLLTQEESTRLLDPEHIKASAIANAEHNGIVFIDEIDKIAARSDASGPDVSRQGVQRDLLPLIEGCAVNTRHGVVRTDHVLFIASGAFHLARPSDLIPELQGRLPIRVELEPLTVDDFVRILTSTDASLVSQATALLATEGVDLRFDPEAITRIAEIAHRVNEGTENIGARRLHTVMEHLLEEISFDAAAHAGTTVVVDRALVDQRLAGVAAREDLARYIL